MISLSLYSQVAENGRTRKITIEQYSERRYERLQTELTTKFQPEELTVSDTNIFSKPWSKGARDLLWSIMGQLYMNNTLWYFKPTNSRQRQSIAELRRAGVLLKTEDPYIHYVNPDHVRRGSKASVLILTLKELEKVTRVSKDNIRPLTHSKNQQELSLYDQSLLFNLNLIGNGTENNLQTPTPPALTERGGD